MVLPQHHAFYFSSLLYTKSLGSEQPLPDYAKYRMLVTVPQISFR